MSEAPVKKVELTRQQRFENLLYGMGAAGHMVGALWWYANLCLAQYRAHKRDNKQSFYFPQWPVTIELFGCDPEQALSILTSYGVTYAYGLLQWAVVFNRVDLRFLFLVSGNQFDYADNILDQHSGQTFVVYSNAGCKRGQALRAPYTQRQPSQTKRQAHPARPKQARLGKVYKARQ
jgi:hypothetical protein